MSTSSPVFCTFSCNLLVINMLLVLPSTTEKALTDNCRGFYFKSCAWLATSWLHLANLGGLVHQKWGFGVRKGDLGGLVHQKWGFCARKGDLGGLVHQKWGFCARSVGAEGRWCTPRTVWRRCVTEGRPIVQDFWKDVPYRAFGEHGISDFISVHSCNLLFYS